MNEKKKINARIENKKTMSFHNNSTKVLLKETKKSTL